MAKTTSKDFQKFISYCLHWQDELGLKDWHLYFFHKSIGDSFADTAASPSGRAVTIRFNTSWPDRPLSDYEIKQCALHEVLHIVTAEMMNEARSRFADEYNLEAAEHSVVTRMTNYIMRLQDV